MFVPDHLAVEERGRFMVIEASPLPVAPLSQVLNNSEQITNAAKKIFPLVFMDNSLNRNHLKGDLFYELSQKNSEKGGKV
jgi:hypothetical protein